MKRIYVAGAYNADNVMGVLANIRRGIAYCAKLFKTGSVPFCPWLDYQFSFFEQLDIEDYYRYSMAWLEVSDELHVLPNSENSKGTQKEIARANALGIPVRYVEDGAIGWRGRTNENATRCDG
jgi:hypothetical protein